MNREIMRQSVQCARRRDADRDDGRPEERLPVAANCLYAAACAVAEAPPGPAPLALEAYDRAVDNLAAAYRGIPDHDECR